MAKIEDFLNGDFKDKKFVLDPGIIALHVLRYEIQNTIYLESMMKHQIKIERLIKGESTDEDDIRNELTDRFKLLDEEVEKEYNSVVIDIIKE